MRTSVPSILACSSLLARYNTTLPACNTHAAWHLVMLLQQKNPCLLQTTSLKGGQNTYMAGVRSCPCAWPGANAAVARLRPVSLITL